MGKRQRRGEEEERHNNQAHMFKLAAVNAAEERRDLPFRHVFEAVRRCLPVSFLCLSLARLLEEVGKSVEVRSVESPSVRLPITPPTHPTATTRPLTQAYFVVVV